ncbi:MAG TPA: serpin family protein [Actinocrinis sp.]|nr:serpin family protein [Actinocrinis sp.]
MSKRALDSYEPAGGTVRDEAISTAVSAANRLTARWAETCDGRGTVLSGLGVWPLLAAIADPASGAAREELAQAIGLPAAEGPDAARRLLDAIDQNPAVHTALGLWTSAALRVNPEWVARLPRVAHGLLDQVPARAQAALDAWVEKETGGLLRRMPIQVDKETLLVLASALTVRTEWEDRFQSVPRKFDGPWAGRDVSGLSRASSIDDVRIAASDDGPVTLATVRGRDEIDVVLTLGSQEARPGAVLAAAVRACGSQADASAEPVNLDQAQPAPGLTVREIRAFNSAPTARLETVAFTVSGRHDLLAHAELFGLGAASDRSNGHFPGISSEVPLCVQAAAQDATASFSAEGFVAAAVTAIAMMAGSAMPSQMAKQLTASFDRPFGFVAVDRSTGLVLVCGWVDEPENYPR